MPPPPAGLRPPPPTPLPPLPGPEVELPPLDYDPGLIPHPRPRTLRDDCLNDADPITFDPITEIPDQNLVAIGLPNYKNCYDVDSLYAYILDRMKNDKPIVDPTNPGYTLSGEELELIFRKKGVFRYPPGLVLNHYDDDEFDHYFITQPNGNVIDLGYVPNTLTAHDTGSDEYTPDVLSVMIYDLWNLNKILDSIYPVRCCKFDVGKPKEYWYSNRVAKFIDLVNRVRDRL